MIKGKVYLIGGGPGDYGLLTLKAKASMDHSDVIVYDRLISSETMSHFTNKELIYVGKASANHTMVQEDINQLLVRLALQGKTVARLKGGDPYVFGRGGEEAEELIKAGIAFEVIPGISSSIGGLCYAGIPITHRDYSSSFHVFTGHFKSNDRDHNWDAIAGLRGTLVFLMGLKNLKRITENLIHSGLGKKTAVAVISNATRNNQLKVIGDLETIESKVLESKIKSPALIVVGKVVELNEKLDFFSNQPLFGKKIVVTRSRLQSSTLSSKLKTLGAEVLEVPAIKIVRLNEAELHEKTENLDPYTTLVFTSTNGVELFFEQLLNTGRDARVLFGKQIVAIGPQTNRLLKSYGIIADLVPPNYIAESVFETMKGSIDKHAHILLPRAKGARSDLVELLKPHCKVTEIKTYEAVIDTDSFEIDFEIDDFDYVTFTSSSTVKNFMKILNHKNQTLSKKQSLVSIGPITSETIRNYSLEPSLEAVDYDVEGLISVLLDSLGGQDEKI